MRRRSGFTLVEVLVSMALILFIMSILAGAFGAASQAVSDLKAAGDLAEKLRGATNVIKRDLEADHFTDSPALSVKLSDPAFWDRLNPGPNAPVGFFRIFQSVPPPPAPAVDTEANEGGDLDNIPSFTQINTSLHYTIALHGTRRSDFLSALVPGTSALLLPNPTGPYANADNFYQDSPGVFSSQYAEVELFLGPTGDFTEGSPGPGPQAQPLFALYRRQQLVVPKSWTQTTPIPAAEAAADIEMSISPGATGTNFNTMSDVSMPGKRFFNPANVVNPAAVPVPNTNPPYAPMGGGFVAADLLLTDVLSFDVRVLRMNVSSTGVKTIDSEFRDIGDPIIQNYNTGLNPAFVKNVAPFVFDTWSNQVDLGNPLNNYSTWNVTPGPTALPLFKDGAGNKIVIQAIQITLRVWDFKTKKTRQVTIVQQM